MPQSATLNGSLWRRLENWVRKLAEQADSVIVVTGAIFAESPERIGAGRVAVPQELYKVVLVTEAGGSRLFAVIMPNAETGDRPLESFLVAVAEVEARTGLKFFPQLRPT